jgi:hypothetical protein
MGDEICSAQHPSNAARLVQVCDKKVLRRLADRVRVL